MCSVHGPSERRTFYIFLVDVYIFIVTSSSSSMATVTSSCTASSLSEDCYPGYCDSTVHRPTAPAAVLFTVITAILVYICSNERWRWWQQSQVSRLKSPWGWFYLVSVELWPSSLVSGYGVFGERNAAAASSGRRCPTCRQLGGCCGAPHESSAISAWR